jgi:amidophosphoribosyltransferase
VSGRPPRRPSGAAATSPVSAAEAGRDGPIEECGVVAVHRPRPLDVAAQVHLGLFALQHRGQESCGICVAGGDEIRIEKDMGLVTEVFTEERLDALRFGSARIGIGHTRYSTTGSSLRFNAQPITVRSNKGLLALAHNGNFTNAKAMRDQMLADGAVFQTTNDSEVMINLVARYSHLSLVDATARVMGELEGGFSVVLMDKRRILGLRDRHGVRPLVIGTCVDGGHAFASEPGALHAMGAIFVRDVRPGSWWLPTTRGCTATRCCRPSRRRAPSSGSTSPAATGPSTAFPCTPLGCAWARSSRRRHPPRPTWSSACPSRVWPLRSATHAVPASPTTSGSTSRRTRDAPSSPPARTCATRRCASSSRPPRPSPGSRIVLVDDSIVRGTTSGRIVQLLREAGATEVHFRVSSPPIRFPCYYGIDTAARKELAASVMGVETIRQRIGADSLHFISEAGLARAIGLERTCLACFNGRYPAGMPDGSVDKESLEEPRSSDGAAAPRLIRPLGRLVARLAPGERAADEASRTEQRGPGASVPGRADAPGPLEPQAARPGGVRVAVAGEHVERPADADQRGRPRPRGGGRGRPPGPRRAPRAAAADDRRRPRRPPRPLRRWWSK